jgi:hypothetical protein
LQAVVAVDLVILLQVAMAAAVQAEMPLIAALVAVAVDHKLVAAVLDQVLVVVVL